MNSPVFIQQLTDAIYSSNLRASSRSHSFDEKVTLTEAVVINGRVFNPGVTLNISRPAIRR